MLNLRPLHLDHELDHEDLFVARYERLLAWAAQLTNGETNAAEDLVHDAFIQFTLARPDLHTIANLDGYLRQMLRNLYVSQGRCACLEEVNRLLNLPPLSDRDPDD